MLEHHERKILEQILEVVLSNQTALADLQSAVSALQAAAATVPADISAGVEKAAADVTAVTTQLTGGAPAPAPAPAPAEPAPAPAAAENPVPDPNPPA